MKNFLTLVLFFSTMFNFAFSQIPRTIAYQGVLANANGTLVPDGNQNLKISLYSSAFGGTALYTETQSVAVVKGIFNIIIGSTTPIPVSLEFDRAYFMGVSVNGGAELSPRTPFTAAPYALHAAIADQAKSLAPGATGIVSSVNGIQGAVTLNGGGSTTVTQNGSVITISSSGGNGGSGIQGVQSPDASLSISNPNGPIANISLANNSVNSGKILDGSITAADIAPGVIPVVSNTANFISNSTPAGGDLSGIYPNPSVTKIQGRGVANTQPNTNQVLSWNGSTNLWEPKTITSGSSFSLPYSGSGNSNSSLFQVLNNDITSTSFAIHGVVNGTSAFKYSAGVHGESKSSGTDNYGVLGTHSGRGTGVYGVSQTGEGVRGTSTGGTGVAGRSTTGRAGEFIVSTPPNSSSVAYAVYAETNANGAAVQARVNSETIIGTALELNNGYMKVSGINKTAFVHTTNSNNLNLVLGKVAYGTELSYPGMASTDILIVTHLYNGNYLSSPFSTQFTNNKWYIYLDNRTQLPINSKFCVLVIKQ